VLAFSAARLAPRALPFQAAAAAARQVARILSYLGDHILMLTRMNLRDYLQLKVQLEGTSGAGSSQVGGVRGVQ
jgi:tryptophan 2,3-dioxygenase